MRSHYQNRPAMQSARLGFAFCIASTVHESSLAEVSKYKHCEQKGQDLLIFTHYTRDESIQQTQSQITMNLRLKLNLNIQIQIQSQTQLFIPTTTVIFLFLLTSTKDTPDSFSS